MPKRLDERALEQLCLDLVRRCQLELPLDPWELCRRLAQLRGRRLTLIGAPLGGPHSVGHLLLTSSHDKIFYEQAAGHGLRAQVICHEVIHLVRGHLEGEAELTCGALVSDPSASSEPRDGGSSNRYTSWQEWEAEVGATYLTGLTRRRRSPRSTAVLDEELGLASAFGFKAKLPVKDRS